MHIVVYRPHNALECETLYVGPFADFGAAYEHLCTLPALGPHIVDESNPCQSPGFKFVQELTSPTGVTYSVDYADPYTGQPVRHAPTADKGAACREAATLARRHKGTAYVIRSEGGRDVGQRVYSHGYAPYNEDAFA